MELVFLAYRLDGSLIMKPSPSFDSVQFAARQYLKTHPQETVKVYSVSDGHPTFESNIRVGGAKFQDTLRAMAAAR